MFLVPLPLAAAAACGVSPSPALQTAELPGSAFLFGSRPSRCDTRNSSDADIPQLMLAQGAGPGTRSGNGAPRVTRPRRREQAGLLSKGLELLSPGSRGASASGNSPPHWRRDATHPPFCLYVTGGLGPSGDGGEITGPE